MYIYTVGSTVNIYKLLIWMSHWTSMRTKIFFPCSVGIHTFAVNFLVCFARTVPFTYLLSHMSPGERKPNHSSPFEVVDNILFRYGEVRIDHMAKHFSMCCVFSLIVMALHVVVEVVVIRVEECTTSRRYLVSFNMIHVNVILCALWGKLTTCIMKKVSLIIQPVFYSIKPLACYLCRWCARQVRDWHYKSILPSFHILRYVTVTSEDDRRELWPICYQSSVHKVNVIICGLNCRWLASSYKDEIQSCHGEHPSGLSGE